MSGQPTGTVTFLFTDLEVSTRLWDQEPDAMSQALARHDAILRDAISVHDGHVVKGRGDGVHAAFATADAALGAAIDAQLAIGGEEWPVSEPLRARMGLHTGAAELRDGDYFGSSVNRAARLMGVGHGGQILVSHATEQLVRDGLPVSVELLGLGEHSLRDLGRPELIFQASHPDLERDFPALQTMDVFPGNLPLQVTSFIGRDVEVAEIEKALADARVVTITGVGGVGKTRLALQVAADVLHDYRDGAWLCELAPASDAASLVEVVANALDVQPRPGQSLEDTLIDSLRSKHLLLVLDNCEHLLEPAARLVDRIVHAAARVTVLATSREGLAVAGERILAAPSLGLGSEAIALFVERASDARAGFALSDEGREAVGQICTRLDGIPLAIELAAARVQAMTPSEIAARLDDQFRLLSSQSRTAVERHQTLRRAIDWSYETLTDDEQRVLQRLSVFQGGCDLAAAEAVTSGDGIESLDVLDHVSSLVRRSLTIADDIGDHTRYRLLEPIRQYAQDRLEESGDAAATGRRHAEHYSAVALEAGPGLRGADQMAWVRRLEPEVENLRAAVEWGLAHDLDLALGPIVALCIDGIAIGTQADAWAELAAASPAIDGHPLGPSVLARAVWRAVYSTRRDDAQRYEDRRVAAEAALGLAPSAADLEAPATLAMFSGEWPAAIEIARRWDALAREQGDDYESVRARNMLAAAHNTTDRAETIRIGRQVLSDARRLGNPSALSFVLQIYGANLALVDPAAALPVLEESVAVSVACGNTGNAAVARSVMVQTRRRLGDDEGALPAYVDALEDLRRAGAQFVVPAVLVVTAATLFDAGEHDAAAVVFGAGDASGPITAQAVVEEREQLIERMTETLDAARIAELTALGASMRDDEIVDYARDVVERLNLPE